MTKDELQERLRDVKASLFDLDRKIKSLRTEKSRKGGNKFLNAQIAKARKERSQLATEEKQLISKLKKIDPVAAALFAN